MGSIYDRMNTADPMWKEMRDRFNGLITGYNGLRYLVKALNPHKTNDETNTAAEADAALDTAEEMRAAHRALEVAYEAHRASTDYHSAADNANGLSAESTPKAVMDLLNDLKAKYNAHRVLVGGPPAVHGVADAVNVVNAAAATTKATAITLANQLKAKFNAHIVLTDGVHGHTDALNNVVYVDAPADATWPEIAALADEIRVNYEAHRVFLDDSCHGAADATNAAAVEAVGVVLTRDYAFINGFKAKFNAHWALSTAHPIIDQSFNIEALDAANLNRAIILTKEAIGDYRAHISRNTVLAMYPTVEAI